MCYNPTQGREVAEPNYPYCTDMPGSADIVPLKPSAHVLYVDHQSHPAPLSECFHATGSRELSSRVFRYPAATTLQVDSAYCPQCLSFYDAATAASMAYCKTCQRCPLCFSPATIHAVQGGVALFKCGLCHWTSRGCGLSAPVSQPVLLEAMEKAQVDLLAQLKAIREERSQGGSILRQAVEDVWQQQSLVNQGKSASLASEWSIELLETRMKEAKAPKSVSFPESMQVKRVSLSELLADPTTSDVPAETSLLSLEQQATSQALLPLPIPLTSRNSRRCRAEIAEGRPGILLKPKLNPLEGDSSLSTGHGQWYRKDSSAIHVIPRVQVLRSATSETATAVLVQVSNPTLSPIRFRFKKSDYQGELDQWKEPHVANPSLKGLLVDTLTQTTQDVHLDLELLRSFASTQTVDLKSSEDSILDLGIGDRQMPSEVEDWSPSFVNVGMQLVAIQSSNAWFELVVGRTGSFGFPLTLDVDVGRGSWESSLISWNVDSDEQETVSFDLVVACQ